MHCIRPLLGVKRTTQLLERIAAMLEMLGNFQTPTLPNWR
jgi:hypothetical protein